MLYFHNDYSEGCHPKVLEALNETNLVQTDGYGIDPYCQAAAQKIRDLCQRQDLAVHFLVGGTQTNLTVIDAALRPHQAALSPEGGHINVHETGAVEATGHKVLALPADGGKITAQQVRAAVIGHRGDASFEHTAQPKLVYISNPTEYGTLYSKAELQALFATCRELGLYLFLDGARLGYGLTARDNDLTLADIARITDVFYIGGTKCGALFGEAVVISNPAIAEDFRYLIKQHGGMLAKGRLLGVQFGALLENNLYFDICARANDLADQIRRTLDEIGFPYIAPSVSNQIFVILPNTLLKKLEGDYMFSDMGIVDEQRRMVRICTSWATNAENVVKLCSDLRKFAQM